MMMRSGWYFSVRSVSDRENGLDHWMTQVPKISSSAVFIWPTNTQHLRFRVCMIRNERDQRGGERDSHMQPFKISLTAVRLLCFAN